MTETSQRRRVQLSEEIFQFLFESIQRQNVVAPRGNILPYSEVTLID